MVTAVKISMLLPKSGKIDETGRTSALLGQVHIRVTPSLQNQESSAQGTGTIDGSETRREQEQERDMRH